MPLPPYIASRRAPDERDRTDYQTMFARGGRLGRRADRRTAFHRRAGRAPRASAASRIHKVTLHVGRRHVPSGQGRGHRRASHAAGGGQRRARATAAALNAVRRAGGRIVAVGSTALRLIESASRRGRRHPSVRGRDRAVHHAGLPLPRRRRDDDQFPPAALDPVHAGRGVLRARGDAARLCARDRAPAIGSIPTAMPACCSARRPDTTARHVRRLLLPPARHRRRRAPRRDRDAAWAGRDAGFHAGRHAGDRQGPRARGGARSRRRHRARQHLSPDAAPGRRTHRGARRAAPVHELAARRS